MKKQFKDLCFIATLIIVSTTTLKAQDDVKRTFGVGLQSSLPTYGLSVKYAFTESSVGQVTVAPFQAGDAKISFYGARYIHRFINENPGSVIMDPYLFAGAGLITFNYSAYGGSNSSFFSYSAGGGLEFIVGRMFGISIEAGYGKLNVTNGAGVAGIFGGGGLHFYIN
ncbi:MAG: hypothetical protein JSR12_09070 [Bacteroidetes bacterium]|nr:hypothetical protein [Bacteroidota bacterium]